MSDDTLTTSYRTCPLCEATCGLEVTMRGEQVVRIRGDRDDPFSRGYICPKGSTLKQLHEDPDRLRAPMVRSGSTWRVVGWDEAFEEVERLLVPIIERYGRESLALYMGNPGAHNLSLLLYNRVLIGGLATPYVYSASTIDQMPKQVADGLMFGTGISVPVPDVDRTDYFLVLGADPVTSNGSLMTAPDMPGRLEALRVRGGRLVVVDPRRSPTAAVADEHLAIRPGTDALLLLAMVHTLFADGLIDLGAVAEHIDGVTDVEAAARPFSPERVAPDVGIDAATIRRITHEVATAPSAAVYGRIGTCTQEFGTLASWLVDVVNCLTGNLDRPGGVMFPKPAAGSPNTEGTPGRGRGVKIPGSKRSRVRGLGSFLGELPAGTLAEEIDTPGPGGERIRALVTVAGNPALSNANSGRLDRALASLDCLVAIDCYLNETTRHAHVILPPPSPLARPHFDVALYRLAVRNVANWSAPTVAAEAGAPEEWEVLFRLAGIAQGRGAHTDPGTDDDAMLMSSIRRATGSDHSIVSGRDPEELFAILSEGGRRGPARTHDFLLRTGPWGDGFGARPDGLSLAALEAAPHGVDLGPLEPRIPEVLRTPSGRVELAPPQLIADVSRLDAAVGRWADGGTVLVGRRHLRSNNSWMHNIDVLVKGKERCTLQVHPADAARWGLEDGGLARVTSRVGSVDAPVEITDGIRPGVVSLPHGWGHDVDGVELAVAAKHPGVNINLLTDEQPLDPLSGNGVLTGVPVTVAPA